jgi:hypothetical protein
MSPPDASVTTPDTVNVCAGTTAADGDVGFEDDSQPVLMKNVAAASAAIQTRLTSFTGGSV